MSDTSLRTLVDQAALLERLLIDSNGEITEEIANLLHVEVAIPDKVDGYSLVMKRMLSLSQFYRDRALRFESMASSMEDVHERCRDNLRGAMEKLGTTEILGNDVKFRLQKSPPSVNVLDETLIPGEYIVTETITKIDRKKINSDVKNGKSVPGIEIVQKTYAKEYMNGGKN